MSEHVRLEKGKISELLVISELLQNGLEVYTPVIDTGIDCVVKSKTKPTKYFELQIKGTKHNVSIRGGKKVKDHAKNNPNYFLVFVSDKKKESSVPDIFYLNGEQQIEDYCSKKKKDGTISLHISIPKRNEYVETQGFDKLVEKIKFCLPAQSIPCSHNL
jgi:DUF917 family protein